ncbi:MAG: NAD-dependent epimerase/dehydratase family protein [Fibrobacter sp.]|nr:NAD-dependent epimerase/dehydratase family protein [Fibrobacter sp.]
MLTDKQKRIINRDCEEIFPELCKFAEDLRDSSLLITGGTGFMGTWITEVITFLNDSFSLDIKLFLMARNAHQLINILPHIAKRKDVTLISSDVSVIYELPDQINYIIHAAGSPDNRLNANDPLRVVRTIVNGTASLLDSASRLQDLRRIVNISSASIYGNQPEEITRIPEKFYSGPDINLAMSAYAEGKRMSEVLCSIYRTQYRMEIVTIRPFAFIGPYQSLDRPWAINNFLSDALNKGPIRILGDGSTVRSYMYPSDMVNWVLNILLRGKNGFVYNMGSTEEIKLMQLAQKIASFFSDKIDIQSNIAPVSNKISRLIPDTSLAEKDLQLRLTVSLDEALFRSIEWFKEDRRINS